MNLLHEALLSAAGLGGLAGGFFGWLLADGDRPFVTSGALFFCGALCAALAVPKAGDGQNDEDPNARRNPYAT